ncbi:hypothetical protein PZ938_02960 [Luteipulveratus sp. YIM 133132]|uniref:hypothetical protein n=1 Tax=Luteipulveratus flavus TaxID=3031728 RepID=UPI0023B18155|nr:hypothetical protein [Luteipulveratus sp. YIM 133132]MDE9364552.1 hypothetical protein [Luteipulveratus sp. YIM 133132]
MSPHGAPNGLTFVIALLVVLTALAAAEVVIRTYRAWADRRDRRAFIVVLDDEASSCGCAPTGDRP